MGVKKTVLEQSWDDKDGPPSHKVTAVIVGCGQRGQNYAAFALDFPSRMEVVGIAEPVSHRTPASTKPLQSRGVRTFAGRFKRDVLEGIIIFRAPKNILN